MYLDRRMDVLLPADPWRQYRPITARSSQLALGEFQETRLIYIGFGRSNVMRHIFSLFIMRFGFFRIEEFWEPKLDGLER